jgi:hypothetical protein
MGAARPGPGGGASLGGGGFAGPFFFYGSATCYLGAIAGAKAKRAKAKRPKPPPKKITKAIWTTARMP